MIQDTSNAKHFTADENKIFVRKEDNIKFGTDMYLSDIDSIENYIEQDMDDADKAWFESLKKYKNPEPRKSHREETKKNHREEIKERQ